MTKRTKYIIASCVAIPIAMMLIFMFVQASFDWLYTPESTDERMSYVAICMVFCALAIGIIIEVQP